MTTLQDIKRECPGEAWAQHLFSVECKLPNKQRLVVRFDLPVEHGQEVIQFSPKKVRDNFKDALGEWAQDDYVCSQVANILNLKIGTTMRTVASHLSLTIKIMQALEKKQMLSAYVLLFSLTIQLKTYRGQLWLYGWPEWITLVENHIWNNSDEKTRKIIKALIKLV